MDIDSQPKEDEAGPSSGANTRRRKRKPAKDGNVAAVGKTTSLARTESQATLLDEDQDYGRKKRAKKEPTPVPVEDWAGIATAATASAKKKGKAKATDIKMPSADQEDDMAENALAKKAVAIPQLTPMQQTMAEKLEGSRFR